MAKKGQNKSNDILGSIFDFIFQESEKPVDKRRTIPAKKINFSTNDAIGETLLSVFEKPGVFVNNVMLGEFERSYNVELGKVNFDARNEIELKVGTKDLIGFLKDPAKAVDKAIKERAEVRKRNRIAFLGESLGDFITTSWAYKYGNLEAQSAARANANANASLGREDFKVAKAVGQYSSATLYSGRPGITVGPMQADNLDYMGSRALDLLGRKTFGNTWENMPDRDKNDFAMVISQTENGDKLLKPYSLDPQSQAINGSVDEIKAFLLNRFGGNVATNFEVVMRNHFPNRATQQQLDKLKKVKRITVFDPLLYKSLELNNLSEKINQLAGAAPGSPEEEERKIYEKTRLMLSTDSHKMSQLKDEISQLKQQLKSETDPDKKRLLKRELDNSRGLLRVFGSQTFFGRLGSLEGTLNSIRSTQALLGANASNVAAAVITGEFFREDKNPYFSPTTVASTLEAGKITIAKKGRNRLETEYNKSLEVLYYFTPRAVFRTFFYNGEGFAWRYNRNMSALEKIFNSFTDDEKDALSRAGIDFRSIKSELDKRTFKGLDTYVKGLESELSRIERLLSSGLSQAEIAKLTKKFKRMESLLNMSKRARNFTKVFSMPFQAQTFMNQAFSKLSKKYRVRFAKTLLRNQAFKDLLIRSGANKLLGKWITSGGLNLLLKSLVTTLVAAVGLVGTPIASFVVSVGTWIASDVVMKMFKATLSIIKYATLLILLLVGFIFVAGMDTVKKTNSSQFTYGYTFPGDVLLCPATNPGVSNPINVPPYIPPGGPAEPPKDPYQPPDPDAKPFNINCPTENPGILTQCATTHGYVPECASGYCVCYDIGLNLGSPVFSTDAGTVVFAEAGYNGGFGSTVKVEHIGPNGTTYYTKYTHLLTFAVKEGDTVSAGTQLGTSGGSKDGGPDAGNTTGPHLHYAVCGLQGGYAFPEECATNLYDKCARDFQ